MEEIMKKIVAVDGVISCYLVDREGEIIGFAGKSKLDKSLASALIASMSKELTTQMDIKDNFSITILAAEKDLFIVTQKNFVFAVFTSPNIDTGKIRFELRKSIKEISEKL
jgi:predicted regulator of Ras-like GTPase activity (Roadblock/LC7/MglB family)